MAHHPLSVLPLKVIQIAVDGRGTDPETTAHSDRLQLALLNESIDGTSGQPEKYGNLGN